MSAVNNGGARGRVAAACPCWVFRGIWQQPRGASWNFMRIRAKETRQRNSACSRPFCLARLRVVSRLLPPLTASAGMQHACSMHPVTLICPFFQKRCSGNSCVATALFCMELPCRMTLAPSSSPPKTRSPSSGTTVGLNLAGKSPRARAIMATFQFPPHHICHCTASSPARRLQGCRRSSV